jgi:hypothetical protein
MISHEMTELVSISNTVFSFNSDDGGRNSLQNVGNCNSEHTADHLRTLHSFSHSKSFTHKRAFSDKKLWLFLLKTKNSTRTQNIFILVMIIKEQLLLMALILVW